MFWMSTIINNHQNYSYLNKFIKQTMLKRTLTNLYIHFKKQIPHHPYYIQKASNTKYTNHTLNRLLYAKQNNIASLQKILHKYQIGPPPQNNPDYSINNVGIKGSRTLQKIAKFKGDRRFNHQDRLNKLFYILCENLGKFQLNQKLVILRMLMKNNEYREVITQKMINNMFEELVTLKFQDKIILAVYAMKSHQKRIAYFPRSKKKSKTDKQTLNRLKIIQDIIKSITTEFDNIDKVQLITYSSWQSKLSTSTSNPQNQNQQQIKLTERDLCFLIEVFASTNQYKKPLQKIITNILDPNIDKISLTTLLRILNIFASLTQIGMKQYLFTGKQIEGFINRQQWAQFYKGLQKKSEEIDSLYNSKFLLQSLNIVVFLQAHLFKNQKPKNSLIIQFLCKITTTCEQEDYHRVEPAKILKMILKIYLWDNNTKFRSKMQNIFQNYLYDLIKDIKENLYTAKELVQILIQINQHRKVKTFSWNNRQMRNIVMAITEEIWHKADQLLNNPLKNRYLIRKLAYLTRQKQIQTGKGKYPNNISNSDNENSEEQLNYCRENKLDLYLNMCNEENNGSYFIQNIPSEILKKIDLACKEINLMEQSELKSPEQQDDQTGNS